MKITTIKRNGLFACLVETADGTVRLMPTPEFIVIGCIEIVSGRLSNWEWQLMLKLWRARVTGSDVCS